MKKISLLLLLFISVIHLEAQTLQSKIIPFNGNPAVIGIEPWEESEGDAYCDKGADVGSSCYSTLESMALYVCD